MACSQNLKLRVELDVAFLGVSLLREMPKPCPVSSRNLHLVVIDDEATEAATTVRPMYLSWREHRLLQTPEEESYADVHRVQR